MRCHPAASIISPHAVQLLAAGPSTDRRQQQRHQRSCDSCSTAFWHTFDQTQAGLSLSNVVHCRCKVLLQQRTYTIAP
jgi:hypothetical protein